MFGFITDVSVEKKLRRREASKPHEDGRPEAHEVLASSEGPPSGLVKCMGFFDQYQTPKNIARILIKSYLVEFRKLNTTTLWPQPILL